ncbi:MAG TPA: hypothetical protein VFA39_15875 [Steroidobacteraceae bacterium]|nr:hypothetical protein [Steroidobacteraceae bacterium]
MTEQTKALFAAIKAELDDKSPGWRTAFSSWDAAVAAAGARAQELTDQYRKAQAAAARAPSTPQIADHTLSFLCDSEGTDAPSSRDALSVFDHSPAGRAVSAERSDSIGAENPSQDAAYEPEDVKAPATQGRLEDPLWRPDHISHTGEPLRWTHTPPRAGAHYGNRCW